MIRGVLGAEQTTDRPSEAPVAGRCADIRRVYPALVFVPLFYLLVRYAPPSAFFGLVAAAAAVALLEFFRLHFKEKPSLGARGLGLSLLGLLLASLQWPGVLSERSVFLLVLLSVLIWRMGSRRELRSGLADSAVLVFGTLYIGLTLGTLLLTRSLPDGEFLIFFVFLVTWAGDTGAYYSGLYLGRHRLAPTISPNKTVEGLAGAFVFALGGALLARAWFLPSFSLGDCLATGLLLTVAGVLGDLAESTLKRSAGVKDSGSVIPAHGGMLDRLDSLLFTAPVFYYYATLVKG
ncbi:MAG: phosphatidate cytidylyltransferase [Nitrospirota bacterium]